MPSPAALTGAQRKWLRGLAHGLDPVVRLGKLGLTEAVLRRSTPPWKSTS